MSDEINTTSPLTHNPAADATADTEESRSQRIDNLAYDDLVTLKFGEEGKGYRIQRSILCGANEQWRGQLEPDRHHRTITQLVQPVEVVSVTRAQTIEHFIYWLLWHDFPSDDNLERRLRSLTLLHEFAAVYEIRKLHDDTMHVFYMRAMRQLYYPMIAYDDPPVPLSCAYFVWKTVNHGRLAELVEDIFLEGCWKDGRKWYDYNDLAAVEAEFGRDKAAFAARRNKRDRQMEGQTLLPIHFRAMRFERAYQEVGGLYEMPT